MIKHRSHQSGAVLVIALAMLLLLTLIGITGTQTSSLEEKMTGNMRDKDLAFQAAESALTIVEASLDSLAVPPATDDNGTGGFYSETSTIPTPEAVKTDIFWISRPVATLPVNNLGNEIASPLYIVQDLGCQTPSCPPNTNTYRITVKATGRSASTVVILQSVYTPRP